MVTTKELDQKSKVLNQFVDKDKKHFQLINKTYQTNTESDYTEKIEALGKNFDYSHNSNHFWGDPELSTFYGTPLYEQASHAQKLALNHLFWVGQYQHTASAEANTMLYNQITSGVFAHIGGYETLCQELDFETSQERYHINTFQKIGYKTKIALLGKESFGNPLHKKLNNQTNNNLRYKLQELPKWESIQNSTFRFLTKLMHQGKEKYYSQYLQEKGSSIPTATGGLAGVTASPTAFKFLSLNWGSSPFLAAQYYSARMVANMSLKTYEYRYYKQFKDLDRKGEFIPTPIAVSHYHLLDESFHTTMSQVIAQEVYRDFPKPTAYEKLLSNVIIFLLQRGLLSGLSAALPATFRDDVDFIPSYYRLLTSPLFNMSKQDTLHWLEKCLCQEHEGFHVNLKYHEILFSDLSRFFGRLEYLWPVNREMRLMAEGGSIEKAIKRNQIAFKQFAHSVNT
ncbi:hypothetical protein [Fischerella sp. PCC 9605]|uniref:hypothetical protein n=1 Tax=Fischerella sp. PCC 9605 TaxID=1173024 RepID=UPI0004B18F08|nr:hypothetical protein [Fischerella sp. PCC 9605]